MCAPAVRLLKVGFALSAAVAMAVAGAPASSAALVERSHDHIVETFEENICGIDVVTTLDIIDNFQIRTNKAGFPLFKSSGRGTITWFNPDTGLSVEVRFTGTSKDLSATDNGDGTVTVRFAVTGIPEQITLPDGTVAIKDVGRVVFADVIDFNGTPGDVSDDVFLSSTVESISGPHPDLESDFTLFCPTVIDGLT